MLVSVLNIVLAAIHGENYYVYVAEQAVRPKFDLSNEYLHSLFSSHSYFILGVLTILVMFISCITGIFYRMPDYDQEMISKMPMFVRALLSVFGGIMCMLYLIYTDGGMTVKTVGLVGICSYITPATFHLIHAAFVKTVTIISNILIKRLVFLFTGEIVDNIDNDKRADNTGDRQDEP